MGARINPERIQQFDQLVRLKATGTPNRCSRKMGISERALYRLVEWLRSDIKCPIAYSKERQSYYYTEKGGIYWGFSEGQRLPFI